MLLKAELLTQEKKKIILFSCPVILEIALKYYRYNIFGQKKYFLKGMFLQRLYFVQQPSQSAILHSISTHRNHKGIREVCLTNLRLFAEKQKGFSPNKINILILSISACVLNFMHSQCILKYVNSVCRSRDEICMQMSVWFMLYCYLNLPFPWYLQENWFLPSLFRWDYYLWKEKKQHKTKDSFGGFNPNLSKLHLRRLIACAYL